MGKEIVNEFQEAQDRTVGERICNNNMSDKVERTQLKKLDEKGEKKGKVE